MAWSAGEKRGEAKRTGPSKVVEMQPSVKNSSGGGAAGVEKLRDESAKERDLAGGMEMLELDFLLGVVEQTGSNDKNDVMMRKLSFNEVLRRVKQTQLDSGALRVYAVNEGNLYGKDIQCEAMKELAKRTVRKSKESS